MDYDCENPGSSSGQCSGDRCIPKGCRDAWPELVGVPGIVAKAAIEKSNPYVTVIPLSEHGHWIMDMCCNRVIMLLSNFKAGGVMGEDSLVVQTPIVG